MLKVLPSLASFMLLLLLVAPASAMDIQAAAVASRPGPIINADYDHHHRHHVCWWHHHHRECGWR
jgi:hypothetical protein